MALTKGVHVVIDQARLPLKQAVYFDTEDGRMMFAIPRAGKTYVGTSDTFYEGDPEKPMAEKPFSMADRITSSGVFLPSQKVVCV